MKPGDLVKACPDVSHTLSAFVGYHRIGPLPDECLLLLTVNVKREAKNKMCGIWARVLCSLGIVECLMSTTDGFDMLEVFSSAAS